MCPCSSLSVLERRYLVGVCDVTNFATERDREASKGSSDVHASEQLAQSRRNTSKAPQPVRHLAALPRSRISLGDGAMTHRGEGARPCTQHPRRRRT